MAARRGEAKFLADYNPHEFPPFALTVDLAIFTLRDGQLALLLVERGGHPYKGYQALPGGHVNHGTEDAETAAVRELGEETGLDWTSQDGHLEQLKTYTDPRRDPRIDAGLHVASIAYVALAPNLPDPTAGDDAANARFWAVADLDIDAQRDAWINQTEYTGAAPVLAYDHALIISDAIERVRAKLEYTTLATAFVDEPFTLPDLHRVYSAVWGIEPDLSNFRRKFMSDGGVLVPVTDRSNTKATRASENGRPPALYRRGEKTTLTPPFTRDNARKSSGRDA